MHGVGLRARWSVRACLVGDRRTLVVEHIVHTVPAHTGHQHTDLWAGRRRLQQEIAQELLMLLLLLLLIASQMLNFLLDQADD